MGFKQVYCSLLEVFPQIDNRVLRAVAIEHSKDVDAACEAVVAEIIPFINLRSNPGSPLSQSLYEGQSSESFAAPAETVNNPVVSAEGQNCHDTDVCNAQLEEGESSNMNGSVLSIQNLENSTRAKISHGEYEQYCLTALQGEDIGVDQNMDLVEEKVGSDDLETKSCTDLVLLSPGENIDVSMSQSSQTLNMEAVEEIIADARNNKNTLFSAMESVISLMKEVELREQAAEQSKQEVSMVGADILAELEVHKQSLQQAKEANSMHAGDVYGEKAILATELRELQSRVLSLADERDQSLSVLNEMRLSLEVRLAAAENEIKSAEQEKLEKGKAAMKALADHELNMEKVVQESKILKQQDEENAKLQEFLMDRGHIVDMLKGEIGVICKDVKLLKESFDDNVPFSKSLSSSQTSCILASSTSSSKNMNPGELAMPGGADPLVMTESEKDAVSCFAQKSLEVKSPTKGLEDDDDDGWEVFDEREVFA